MLAVVQAAEGCMLEALSFGNSGPDALLSALDHTVCVALDHTISVCRLGCDFMSWLTSNHLILKPVNRDFNWFQHILDSHRK